MWYYLVEGQQRGPVDEPALDQLISSGIVNAASMVWRQGMADWLPLREARPSASMPSAPPPFLISNEAAWHEGNKVVTQNEKSLPMRCFKCNHPGEDRPLKRKVYWHPPGYYWLIPLGVIVRAGLLVYIIVMIFVRKKATINLYLCARHTQRRKFFIIGGWSGTILSFVLLGVGIANSMTWLIIASSILFIVALFGSLHGASLTRATRIEENTVWLKGAGREFLASLPPKL